MTIREEVVGFGTDSSLVGIVTHPDQFDVDRPAILLLAGGWPRIGPLRLLVGLSRHLAGLGFLCLRFDFSGLGESAPRQDQAPRARSDILETIEAMDFLQTTFGVRRFVGLGLCRGARVCLATAAQDPRITALVLIQSDVLTENRRESAIWRQQSSRADFRSLARLSSWLRLLRGKAEFRSRFAMLRMRMRRGLDTGQNESDRVAAGLALLSARCVQILFLFSPEETGYHYLLTVLKNQKQFRQPLPGMRIELVSQPGHEFRTQVGQRAVLQATGRFVAGCAIPISCALSILQ